MRTCKELKRLSRESLTGHYKIAMLMMIVASVLVSIVNSFFDISIEPDDIYALTNPQLVLNYLLAHGLVVSVVASIIIGLVATVLSAGQIRFYLALARYEDSKLNLGTLFSQFTHRPDRFIISAILIGLIEILCFAPVIIVCTLLFLNSQGNDYAAAVIAFIVLFLLGLVLEIFLAFRFSQIFYILVDTDLGPVAAMKESFRMMKGHCLAYLYMTLSFIPMGLLMTITLYIGSLWIVPYMNASFTHFYLEVSGELDAYEEKLRRMEDEMGPSMEEYV